MTDHSAEVEVPRGPLDGLLVVDGSSYMSGPFAGMMLADLGADVIKVEHPKGDPCRRIGRRVNGTAALFINTNRGKRAISLDLKLDSDHELMLELIRRADVFIENWRPEVARRLHLEPAELGRLNPALIHLSITGYGDSGPWAGRGSFDSAAQAVSGLAWHNQHGGRPEVVRTFIADKGASMFAVQAILAGLYQRERTGLGSHVGTNLLDAQSYLNFPDMGESRTAVDDPRPIDPERLPSRWSVISTSDGWIVVAATTRRQVEAACTAVGHPEWHAILREFNDFHVLAPELMSRLESETVKDTTEVWLKRFTDFDVPASPVLDIDEHLDSPQIQHNATYGVSADPNVGSIRYARYPALFGYAPRAELVHGPTVPQLDADGEAVRAWLAETPVAEA